MHKLNLSEAVSTNQLLLEQFQIDRERERVGYVVKLFSELVNLKHIVVRIIQSDRFYWNALKERKAGFNGQNNEDWNKDELL